MSSFNYSKWDSIGDDDSDDEGQQSSSSSPSSSSVRSFGETSTAPSDYGSALPSHLQDSSLLPTIASNQTAQKMTKKGKEGRYRFEYEGRLIYEWEQSLEEVNIYVEPPPGIPRHLYDIEISHKHLRVGLKDTPPFIDEDTWGPVKSKESFWTLVDGELNVNLQKMNKAEAWEAALVGRAGQQVDPFTKEEVKKKIMLERFQEEHPGFDFSGAEFNGAIPNAQDFMGGVKRTF